MSDPAPWWTQPPSADTPQGAPPDEPRMPGATEPYWPPPARASAHPPAPHSSAPVPPFTPAPPFAPADPASSMAAPQMPPPAPPHLPPPPIAPIRDRRLSSLSSRVLLVTIAVAVIAVLVAAIASFGLVQAAETREARSQLAAQVAALAERPEAETRIIVRDARGLDARDEKFALVEANGRVVGAARAVVVPRVLTALERGRTVSQTVDVNGVSWIVDGRTTDIGTAVVGAVRVADIQGSARLVLGEILIAFAIALAVAIGAGVLLTRVITRPLRHTVESATRLAAGERDVAVPTSSILELDHLSRALATLDQALSAGESRRSEFLLSVSHEMRTPLTAIRGYAEAIADGVLEPDRLPSVGATLVGETERLDRFVADLLELARLDADDFRIERVTVDLEDLVESAARAWGGAAERAMVSVQPEPHPGGVGLAFTDPMRVRQLLDGLIENALRAAPGGSTIRLRLRREGEWIALEVADEGPGLSETDVHQAFRRGVLWSRYRNTRPVGTGLGLSIAARLTERLGGSIGVTSAPGRGTVFAVRLPAG